RHLLQAGEGARRVRRGQVQLHRRRRGRHAGDHQVDGRGLSRRYLGQLVRRVLLGRDGRPQGLRRAAVEVSEGRVPVVVGDPGLHRHAVPGRGHQEGEQPGVGQGLEGADGAHGRDAGRPADDPREGSPGQPRPALWKDGERPKISVSDYETRDVRRPDQIHGLGRMGGAKPPPFRPPIAPPRLPDPSFVFAQSVSGLTAAMFLFLIAAGLPLIFGVLRVLNFAHGTFYMLGAYSTFQLVQWLGVSGGRFWLTALGGALVIAALGGLVERFLFRRLYGKDELYQLLFTYALALILGDAAKMLWGTQQKSVSRPPELTGAVHVFGATIPYYNLFIILLGPAIALAFWLVLQRTRVGRYIRAAA